jgi:IS1 family transposase
LPVEIRVQILSMLCKGSSMRSVSRITGVSINSVSKLLIDAGLACAAFHDVMVRNVAAKAVQRDEIWSFNYAKKKNVKSAKSAPEMAGDIWTWTAIDPDSKLIVTWHVGDRSADTGTSFMSDLKGRLSNKVRLSTDGHRAYQTAVKEVDLDADYDFPGPGRYTPPQCIGSIKQTIQGNPNPDLINTSVAERQNLTMRMSMRHFTRLTNAFSKKLENHCHALALYFYFYNFCRVHKTTGVTPGVGAGLTNRIHKMADIIAAMDVDQAPGARGRYKKQEPTKISN